MTPNPRFYTVSVVAGSHLRWGSANSDNGDEKTRRPLPVAGGWWVVPPTRVSSSRVEKRSLVFRRLWFASEYLSGSPGRGGGAVAVCFIARNIILWRGFYGSSIIEPCLFGTGTGDVLRYRVRHFTVRVV